MNIVDDNDLPLTVPAQLHIEWEKKKKKGGSQSQSPERNLE